MMMPFASGTHSDRVVRAQSQTWSLGSRSLLAQEAAGTTTRHSDRHILSPKENGHVWGEAICPGDWDDEQNQRGLGLG